MRVFKFRAWAIKEEKWVPFDGFVDDDIFWLFFNKIKISKMPPDIMNDYAWTIMPKNRVKIMQWTGLKDKAGVDIYEGDITRVTEKTAINADGTIGGNAVFIAVVEYDKEVAGFMFKGFSDYMVPKEEELEVIGNIFQNKELLK